MHKNLISNSSWGPGETSNGGDENCLGMSKVMGYLFVDISCSHNAGVYVYEILYVELYNYLKKEKKKTSSIHQILK